MKTALHLRLMATFFVVITALAGVAMMILAHGRTTANTYQESLSHLIRITELTRAVEEGAMVLGRLATGPSPEATIAEFRAVKERILELRGGLNETTANPAAAYVLHDLDRMVDSFLTEQGAALYAFQGGDLELYFHHDREAAIIAGYIRSTADRLLADELDTYGKVYPEVIRRDHILLKTNLAILGAATLLALVFAWSFARGVSDPLRALATAASRITRGDLDGPPVKVGSGLELELFGKAFNQMQESLGLLREAELRALHSQVNPHFLFNTLNLVAKTALIEGADRTCTLLETVADLLRYSLRQLDRPVTLQDEVEQVERYLTIQGERFRDRLRFTVQLDPACLGVPIPCMSLQPLVENALIHGIGSREEGGWLSLSVAPLADGVKIAVADNGVGIPPDRLADLTGDGGGQGASTGHTTGIGLRNVRRRLQLFFDDQIAFALQSQVAEGTTITIILPRREGVETGAHSGGRRRAH